MFEKTKEAIDFLTMLREELMDFSDDIGFGIQDAIDEVTDGVMEELAEVENEVARLRKEAKKLRRSVRSRRFYEWR